MGRRSSDTDRQSAMPRPLSDNQSGGYQHGYYLTQAHDVYFVHSFTGSVLHVVIRRESRKVKSTRQCEVV